MPIYEFICSKCQLKFEKTYSRTNDLKKEECPNCYAESDRVVSMSNFRFAESKAIPKEIDKKVGKDAEKRWLEYEDRKKVKDKIREDSGTPRLSRNPDGSYEPFSMVKDNKVVTGDEGVKLRKEMFENYREIRNDPKTEKIKIEE